MVSASIFSDMYYLGSGILSMSLVFMIFIIRNKTWMFSDLNKITHFKNHRMYYIKFNFSWWLLIPADYLHCYLSSLRHDTPSYFDVLSKYSILNYFWMLFGGVVLNLILNKYLKYPYKEGRLFYNKSIIHNSNVAKLPTAILVLMHISFIYSVFLGDFLSVPIYFVLTLLFYSLRSRIICYLNSQYPISNNDF